MGGARDLFGSVVPASAEPARAPRSRSAAGAPAPVADRPYQPVDPAARPRWFPLPARVTDRGLEDGALARMIRELEEAVGPRYLGWAERGDTLNPRGKAVPAYVVDVRREDVPPDVKDLDDQVESYVGHTLFVALGLALKGEGVWK